MAAFIKLAGIDGEAADTNHAKWVTLETFNSPITRAIAPNAKGTQRNKGTTAFGDIVLSKHVDKATTKMAAACASGTYMASVEIHLCNTYKGKEQPYLTLLLKNVIITSHSVDANGTGNPPPVENFTLGFTAVEWNYIVLDPTDGSNKGNVPAKYDLETGETA